jgi:hypothetical protein
MANQFAEKINKRFVLNWIIIAFVAVIFAAAGAGRDSIDGSIDIFTGVGVIGSLFGGVTGFIGLIILLGALGLTLTWFLYIEDKDYTGKDRLRVTHAFISIAIVIVAAVIGFSWFNWPGVSGWWAFGALAVITLAAVAVTHRKKSTTPAARTMAPLTADD